MQNDQQGFAIYGLPIRGRSCGSCKLCCTLLPVELETRKKLANEKCEHLCSKGCSIYSHRPKPCEFFNCRWLFDENTANMRRPDKTGYVIDPMLDGILANESPIDVIQIWVDPSRRDAHRDPALREYVAKIAEIYRIPAIVRWSSEEGMLLVAPILNADNEWVEYNGDKMNMRTEAEMKQLYNRALEEDGKGGRSYKIHEK